ncbi:MAG TPA: hypothetical protein ENK06_14665 [Gammaproteobacteria bacterium]|nr:hypothetical protein [Gammaproteobacteria bacterium]
MNHTISYLILDSTGDFLQSTVHTGTALIQKIACRINARRNNLAYSRNIRVNPVKFATIYFCECFLFPWPLAVAI